MRARWRVAWRVARLCWEADGLPGIKLNDALWNIVKDRPMQGLAGACLAMREAFP